MTDQFEEAWAQAMGALKRERNIVFNGFGIQQKKKMQALPKLQNNKQAQSFCFIELADKLRFDSGSSFYLNVGGAVPIDIVVRLLRRFGIDATESRRHRSILIAGRKLLPEAFEVEIGGRAVAMA
jgi:hypothetical protein